MDVLKVIEQFSEDTYKECLINLVSSVKPRFIEQSVNMKNPYSNYHSAGVEITFKTEIEEPLQGSLALNFIQQVSILTVLLVNKELTKAKWEAEMVSLCKRTASMCKKLK